MITAPAKPETPDDLEALIKEARAGQRRRRRSIAAILAASAAIAVLVVSAVSARSLSLAGHASGAVLCASPPSAWKQRMSRAPGVTPALELTNFHFGRAAYLNGHDDPALRWPHDGILITISDWTASATKSIRAKFQSVGGAPQLAASDFSSFEGVPYLGRRLVRWRGKLLEIWVQARPTTPATIAAADRALSTVRLCHS